ncbi:FxsA family protein [Sagittula salina]|uniref:FxsA family protein n=1 Tax=Sagittula salina TaxID=2820268 RepID=A0A940MQV7_9RHOB|nr:FxsA family protein [Sagittula salina]MBP0483322.1 FxsA family protein [Sagittula salina]
MWLFMAFLLVPLIEIGLFIQVGGLIGLWPTLLIVVLTAVLGTYLVKAQGARAMNDLRRSFSQLEDPSEPLAHGAMILVSGALLLTPGFFTDAVGFALLAPPVRVAVFRWLRKRVTVTRFQMGGQMGGQFSEGRPGGQPGAQPPRHPASKDVIDGEFTEMPSGKSPTHPGSGWTRH